MVDIKKFLSKGDEEEREYFWSLIIEPGWVSAGIWRIYEDKAQVVATSAPVAWELDEELINAADSTLSSAIQGFPQDLIEPKKCVFGVTSTWVLGGEIKGEYLEKIKNLCKELSLNPIGFVVIPEAISHFIKSEEGSPLSAGVVGIYEGTIEISVFRLGNLAGTAPVARSVALTDDVVEGLARFSKDDSLPSRFLLYDGREGELEEIKQTLLKVNWEDYEKLKFLHTPKVEIIDSKTKIYAICLAGASELAKVTKVEAEVDEQVKSQKLPEFQQEEVETPKSEKPLVEELGFVLEKDITQLRTIEASNTLPEERIDDSLANIEPLPKATEFKIPLNRKTLTGVTGSVKNRLSTFLKSIGVLRSLFVTTGKKPIAFGAGFLTIFIILGFALWWFYPKATITIYISPKKLQEETEVIIDTKDKESNLAEKTLSGELLQLEVSGEKTKETTGTKTVGEKAKGEVTLFRVGTQLTLPAASILHGPENLNFSLDDSVTLASGSAGSPATTKAKVSAQDIGAQYNLAAGANFSVGNYSTSDIEAKNESAFSGGSSREISAVSSEDQDVLEEDLQKELKERAGDELIDSISKEKLFIDDSMIATASSRTFSHKVGDEAQTLKLSMSLETKALAVNKKQLQDLSKEVLKDKIPQGFVLRGEQMEFGFEFEKESKGDFIFRVRVSANLLPDIKTEDIIQKIRGKYPPFAEEYLTKEVPGFVRAEIKLKPKLTGRIGTLPHVAKNIGVEIAAER